MEAVQGNISCSQLCHGTQRSYTHQINYSLPLSQLSSLGDLVPLMKKGLQGITDKVGPKDQKAWTEAQNAGENHVKRNQQEEAKIELGGGKGGQAEKPGGELLEVIRAVKLAAEEEQF